MPGKNLLSKIKQEGDDIPTYYLVVDDDNDHDETDGEVVLDFSSAVSLEEDDQSVTVLQTEDSGSPKQTTFQQEGDNGNEVEKPAGFTTSSDKLLKHELEYFGDYVSSALKTLPPMNAYAALMSIVRILAREKNVALEKERQLSCGQNSCN